MASNGAFPQLFLQVMQPQTIDRSEDMAFGDRKPQLRPHLTDRYLLAVGMWANKLTSLGCFSSRMCKSSNYQHTADLTGLL